jgi:hypothetical protein
MHRITLADDSLQIRLFQAALQVATSLTRHIGEFEAPENSSLEPLTLVDEVDTRWRRLGAFGDRKPQEYCSQLSTEWQALAREKGYEVFRHVDADLQRAFDSKKALWEINERALKEAKRCVMAWGGPQAQRRLVALRLLPIHCETGGGKFSEFYFDRMGSRLLMRVGELELLLLECIVLEFSLFHEYLSHAFPSWKEDYVEMSEGFLFALEFQWFESNYNRIDTDVLQKVWRPRLEKNRKSLGSGQWLLRQCGLTKCARKFLLEWAARWGESTVDVNKDLFSQILGIGDKIGFRLFAPQRPKEHKILGLFREELCDPCESSGWDFARMRDNIRELLAAYRLKNAP